MLFREEVIKMTEGKKDKTNLKNYVNSKVKIILSNQMHYNGLVLSAGEEYIKIRDLYDKEVIISIKHICSIQKEGIA